MPLFPSFPDDALVKDIYPLNAPLFRDWCKVEEAIMRGPSAFTPGERELMGAYVSRLNSCTYCYSSHSEAAICFGVDPAVFEPLMEGLETAPIDDKMRPVFRFLKKLTETPYRMVQADADAVFEAGWDERALQDAILVCCCYSFMNRLVDGHGLPSDPSLFKARGKRHYEEGYVAQYASETADDN
jgi:uncharacterized peroxidase-related enzyme